MLFDKLHDTLEGIGDMTTATVAKHVRREVDIFVKEGGFSEDQAITLVLGMLQAKATIIGGLAP